MEHIYSVFSEINTESEEQKQNRATINGLPLRSSIQINQVERHSPCSNAKFGKNSSLAHKTENSLRNHSSPMKKLCLKDYLYLTQISNKNLGYSQKIKLPATEYKKEKFCIGHEKVVNFINKELDSDIEQIISELREVQKSIKRDAAAVENIEHSELEIGDSDCFTTESCKSRKIENICLEKNKLKSLIKEELKPTVEKLSNLTKSQAEDKLPVSSDFEGSLQKSLNLASFEVKFSS